MSKLLVYFPKFQKLNSIMTARLNISVSYFGSKIGIDKTNYTASREHLLYSVHKMAESRQNLEKIVTGPIRILQLSYGILRPAIVSAAENKDRVNVLVCKKAL